MDTLLTGYPVRGRHLLFQNLTSLKRLIILKIANLSDLSGVLGFESEGVCLVHLGLGTRLIGDGLWKFAHARYIHLVCLEPRHVAGPRIFLASALCLWR